MDVMEAIRNRSSIRGFKPDPVPQNLIREILETAVRSPSALNSQPWEFAVITGPVLEQIRQANVMQVNAGAPPALDHVTGLWPKDSIYRERQVSLGKALFGLMEIAREDIEKRRQWQE